MADTGRIATSLGVGIGVLLFISLAFIAASDPFPNRTFNRGQLVPATPPDEIGPAMSDFLWHFREFDLLMQSLVLFATSICCLAMLRKEQG